MNKAAILALTSTGIQLAKELRGKWDQEIPIFVSEDNLDEEVLPFPTGKFSTGIQVLFKQYDALICIMATGIVVRSIAGVLEDKRNDPAIVVIDEKGRHTISLFIRSYWRRQSTDARNRSEIKQLSGDYHCNGCTKCDGS